MVTRIYITTSRTGHYRAIVEQSFGADSVQIVFQSDECLISASAKSQAHEWIAAQNAAV